MVWIMPKLSFSFEVTLNKFHTGPVLESFGVLKSSKMGATENPMVVHFNQNTKCNKRNLILTVDINKEYLMDWCHQKSN